MPRPGSAAASGPPGNEGPAADDTLARIVQLYLICLTSGLRYWSRVAETWARIAPALARGLAAMNGAPGGSAEERASLLDELRAGLRELAELPAEEWRALETELERLGRGGHPGRSEGADRAGGGPYWRRWEAKP
jgi:hypothetical protein